ncbi:MAG: ZIP family metal transporter [Longimicrobiales bacterium]
MSELRTAPRRTPTSSEPTQRVESSETREPPAPRWPAWLLGVAPLLLVAGLVLLFLRVGPLGVFDRAFPPVEELTVQRVTLPQPGLMRVHVVNGGPEDVTVAQVLVDDATWLHTIDGPRTVPRLQSRTIEIPYPWVEGEPHEIAIVTSTGLTFSTTVEVATQSPAVGARYLSTFALLGIYVGVLPVLLGLLWLPFLRRIRTGWVDFFLALTVGLLVFLAVDALGEALELAALVPGAYQGLGLVTLGLIGTPLLLATVGGSAERGGGAGGSALYLAGLVALGIGLHNLGEGLVIGAAYATGEIALGTFLVIGFLLHNTTEGLAIVAPLAKERPRLRALVLLGLIAGVPTILGAWIGGFTYSPIWSTLFFAIGAGAIVQVVIVLAREFLGRRRIGLAEPRIVFGLLAGMVLMYVTGLFVAA